MYLCSAGADFDDSAKSVVIPAGANMGCTMIPISRDGIPEGSERFEVDLQVDPGRGTVMPGPPLTVTIMDSRKSLVH